MIARLIVTIAAVGLVGAQVIRNAAVSMLTEAQPAKAAEIWRANPSVEISLGMVRIGEATRARQAVPSTIFSAMADAAGKAPLAPEPFLVSGVRAQLAGDGRTAERAFESAQWRDPRSLAAAYFLADRYFRTGQTENGLVEIGALAELAPKGQTTVAPYLANYARDPANWPALRKLFRAKPALGDVTLMSLSSNAATAPAVLALADPKERLTKANWFVTLLETLAAAGQYDKARETWKKAVGAPPNELIHDSGFSDSEAPLPFNWSLTSSTVGLAERQPGGRLHILFYGQDDGVLAAQMLVLPPGAYRLSMQLLGDHGRAKTLTWSLWCDKASTPLTGVTLDVAAARGWTFQVPANCAAQWLKLAGSSTDISQQVDVTVARFKLERVPVGA